MKPLYTGPDRRKDMPTSEILRRLDEQDEAIDQIGQHVVKVSDDVSKSLAEVEQIRTETAKLVAFFDTLENGALVLCRVAKAIDWIIEKTLKVWKPTFVLFAIAYWCLFQKLPEWALNLLAKLTP